MTISVLSSRFSVTWDCQLLLSGFLIAGSAPSRPAGNRQLRTRELTTENCLSCATPVVTSTPQSQSYDPTRVGSEDRLRHSSVRFVTGVSCLLFGAAAWRLGPHSAADFAAEAQTVKAASQPADGSATAPQVLGASGTLAPQNSRPLRAETDHRPGHGTLQREARRSDPDHRPQISEQNFLSDIFGIGRRDPLGEPQIRGQQHP